MATTLIILRTGAIGRTFARTVMTMNIAARFWRITSMGTGNEALCDWHRRSHRPRENQFGSGADRS